MITLLKRWAPALIMMAIIFIVSSQPSSDLPDFDWLDRFVKKGGHVIGYGLLALSYFRALGQNRQRYWLAWALTLLYAITDEIHQSFVPGRRPSVWDVFLYDNLGAIAALYLHNYRSGKYNILSAANQKNSDSANKRDAS